LRNHVRQWSSVGIRKRAGGIAYQLPILPVGTAGARRVWPPLTLRLRSGLVAVEIGPPIPVAGLTLADRDYVCRLHGCDDARSGSAR
jgi:1-acyl-sn-glycerol-3-phosphate acyltransferase